MKVTGDDLFVLAELEAGGVCDDLASAIRRAASEARRVLDLTAGPLSDEMIALLLGICREEL